jgi:hypothetical protein
LIAQTAQGWSVAVPVLWENDYRVLSEQINRVRDALDATVGDAWRAFLQRKAQALPPHLKSVPEQLRIAPAGRCFPMAILREAYDRGLHLQGVAECCPPVVLVCRKLGE